jgi:integrase
MMKRRLKDAGLPEHLSPHSFRVTTITDLLEQGVPLEDVQRLVFVNRRNGSQSAAGCRRQSDPVVEPP